MKKGKTTMTKLTTLPNNSDELQGKLDYLTNEIRETYPIYSAVSESMKNPFVTMVLSDMVKKSRKTQLFSDVSCFKELWDFSVEGFLTSLDTIDKSYDDFFQIFVDLGKTYGVQYGFQVLEGLASDTLVFSITLPNSSNTVFTQEVEVKSTRDFLIFMKPHLLSLPYHQVLNQILGWSSSLNLDVQIFDTTLNEVVVYNSTTKASVILNCSNMLCNFEAKYPFSGENKTMFVETSQGYKLAITGLGESDELWVSKLETDVPLPCVARKVIDLLGELPIFGEKTAKGVLWTYK